MKSKLKKWLRPLFGIFTGTWHPVRSQRGADRLSEIGIQLDQEKL